VCLHRAGDTHQNDLRSLVVAGILTVVVTKREIHGFDDPRPSLPQLLDHPGLLLRAHPEGLGESVQRRSHQVPGLDRLSATLGDHLRAQVV
jgi:hypothetical protein